MNNTDMITSIYVLVDEAVKSIPIQVKPGPKGKLSQSEIITIMIMQPILMPFCDLKRYYRMIENNYGHLFPNIPCYTRIVKLFESSKEVLTKIMKVISNLNSFGLVVDGTCISVMETIRGKYAKSFRNARKVPCTSKREWYWGFILVLMVDQQGTLPFASLGKDAEITQFKQMCRGLRDRWILSDRGFRNHKWHKELWENQQVRIKMTGGKERQWIENIFGFLKDKLGLARIRKIRKFSSFFVRVFSMLCAYNLKVLLNLPI
ncbi:MAG: hypothetical protein A2298_01665 [Gammaproteobacteria bacterium RIFOXYB2_FULL_38_6]|nr:MAG: hypothetical protein A2298_01665 [Gammaproteobacteria bacterium RIFOXYB2_FULL_38_6]